MKQLPQKNCQAGFTLIEMMLVVAVLVIILGTVFSQMNVTQWRYKTEENRLDATQEVREFVDEITRDVHQAGYPDGDMYNSVTVSGAVPAVCTTYTDKTICSQKVAAGLVKISPTELLFEGDLDNNGNVESVHYFLQTDSSGNCPCTLQRSSIIKSAVGDGDPLTSYAPNYTIELQNVVNSGGAYTIDGSSTFTTGSGRTTILNNTLYSAYSGAPIFQALDVNGVDQGAQSIATTAGETALSNVKSIRVVINVLANPADLQTGMRPAVSMVGDARVGNPFW
jgi:prepilin-type N-terminal cleavage/methylation domain-containing protein